MSACFLLLPIHVKIPIDIIRNPSISANNSQSNCYFCVLLFEL